MANLVKVSFNETTYEFKLDAVINASRSKYTILINGVQSDSILIYTAEPDYRACYEVLQPAGTDDTDGEYRYNTPYKQYYTKDFPMSIVFDIIKFLNK
jgi:hypothetical protein